MKARKWTSINVKLVTIILLSLWHISLQNFYKLFLGPANLAVEPDWYRIFKVDSKIERYENPIIQNIGWLFLFRMHDTYNFPEHLLCVVIYSLVHLLSSSPQIIRLLFVPSAPWWKNYVISPFATWLKGVSSVSSFHFYFQLKMQITKNSKYSPIISPCQ